MCTTCSDGDPYLTWSSIWNDKIKLPRWQSSSMGLKRILGSCKLNSEGRQLRNLSLLFYESTDKTIKVADRMIELMDKSKKLMDNPKML